MRYAYVANTVSERAEASHGPVDAEWLLDSRADLEPIVLVDHDSPGVQRLRDAGIAVIVSGKRPSHLPSGVTLSADHVQARVLVQEHLREPVDFVLYSTGVTTDLAWFEPELAAVPRGVAIGEGPVHGQRLVFSDASLFTHFGRMLWGGTGFVTTADFLFGDVPASAYGFKDEAMPPRLSTGLLDDLGAPSPPEAPPELLAVVATTEDGLGLAQLLGRVPAAVPVDERTTIVVVHDSLPVGPENTRGLILAGCPEELARSTIIVAPGDDGSAASFLASADFVIAAGPGDLAIRAVADAARRTGFVLLRGDVPAAALRLDAPPPSRPPGDPIAIVRVPDRVTDLVDMLDRLDDDMAGFVLHGDGFAEEAQRFVGLPGFGSADVAILGEPDPVYGSPSPNSACAEVLAVGREAWPSVRRRADGAESLWELIRWTLNPDLAEHVRLLVLPGSGRGCRPLPSGRVAGLPVWITSNGALPRPVLAGDPGDAGEPSAATPVREWAAAHSWRDRARLALPWRAGLLDRAMREKW